MCAFSNEVMGQKTEGARWSPEGRAQVVVSFGPGWLVADEHWQTAWCMGDDGLATMVDV